MSLPVWEIAPGEPRRLVERVDQPGVGVYFRHIGVMATPELAQEVVEMQRRRTLGGIPPEVDSEWANLPETPAPPSASDPDAPPHTRAGLRSSTTKDAT